MVVHTAKVSFDLTLMDTLNRAQRREMGVFWKALGLMSRWVKNLEDQQAEIDRHDSEVDSGPFLFASRRWLFSAQNTSACVTCYVVNFPSSYYSNLLRGLRANGHEKLAPKVIRCCETQSASPKFQVGDTERARRLQHPRAIIGMRPEENR